MVACITNARGVGGGGAGIDDRLINHDDASSSIIRNRSNSPTTSHLNPQKKGQTTITAHVSRRIRAELLGPSLSSPLPQTHAFKGNNSNSNNNNGNLRRVRSDNLAQSKRNDPSVRRSIFGSYFQEQPRSFSVPHLVRAQPPQPLPQQQQQQQQSSRRSYKRSSSSDSPSSSSFASTKNGLSHHLSRYHQPVDYRVFAPSEQQIASSAICSRFRELNREHQKDYESLLDRQVRVEHSLPPFPSPLRRFCSDTTTTVAGADPYSSSYNNGNRASGSFSSSNGEIHYHGVYSLLKPVSILRPSRYTSNSNSLNNNNSNTCTIANTISKGFPNAAIDTSNESAVQIETEDQHHHLSASLSSSFNFPRSFTENATILKNFATATDGKSVTCIDMEEEKKENDQDCIAPAAAANTTFAPSPFLSPEILQGNTGIGAGLAAAAAAATTNASENSTREGCCGNDSKDKMMLPEQHQQRQRLRFDPRVTITEFEDPTPRTWYGESELDQLKREAIALAQSYLRKHPSVAGWYSKAVLDPVTKTYRKRALYSLPVFSSTYNSSDADPNMGSNNLDGQQQNQNGTKTLQDDDQPTLSVQKILIVDPNPAIASLFCKSMKSMFPSAELVTAWSAGKASRLIEESFGLNNGSSTSTTASTTTTSFDIIIVEQRLTPQSNTSNSKSNSTMTNIMNNLDMGPFGFLNIFKTKDRESTTAAAPSMSCDIRHGSDLIEHVSKLSLEQHQRNGSTSSSCLLIGVSVRPERDAGVMRRAGADIVWGIPIPSVGDTLRNKLLSKLLAKRYATSSSTDQ